MTELGIDWNHLEAASYRTLKFACQQLRLRPNGQLKKDYIKVLRAHHNSTEAHHSEEDKADLTAPTDQQHPLTKVPGSPHSVPETPARHPDDRTTSPLTSSAPPARGNQISKGEPALRHSFPPIDSIRSSPRSRNRTMSPSRNNFEIWLYIGVGSFLILFLVVLVLMN